jgi:hypothetical protein
MATENTDDKILSPFYGRKKDIDPKDPEQEITQEQKAQMVEQFKSDTKTFLDKEEARIIEDVKTQKPVPALSRIEEIGEYTERSNEQKSALLKEKSELVERKSKLESDFSQAGIALKENLQSEIEEIDRVVTDIDKALPSRLRPGAPTPSKPQVEIPTKLPDHGIRSLYTTEERILERASRATGLPPESPTTHRIAAMLAEGDPFSTEAFERARQESIKLFKAGLVPHPDYDESFGKEIAEFLDWANPAAVEILGTLGTAVVTSPLLAAPEPTTKATWYGVNASSAAFWNYIAQIMEVGSGKREEVRWSEVFASGAVGAIPGSKIVKDASKLQIMTRRGLEGAGIGAGYEAVKLGFDALYGDPVDTNFLASAGLGGVIGALLGKWEKAFVIYEASASEQGAAYLRKMLTDELKQLKREAKRDPKVYLKVKEKIEKKEAQLKELIPTEEKVTQRAIDALEQAEKKQMEEVAKVAEAFKKTEAFKLFQDIDVQGTGAAVSTGVPGVLPKQLAGAKPRYNYGDRNIELNFENDIAKALYIAGSGQSSKRKQEYIDWLKSQGVEDVAGLAKQVRDGIKSQAKAGQDSVFIKSPFKFVEPPAPEAPKAAQALKESDVPTAKVEEAKVEAEPEAWDPTEVPLGIRRTPVIEPELAALDDEALELAQKQALKDAEPLEDEFFGYPTKGAWFTAPKDLARRLGEAQDKVTAIELEIFRRQIDTEEPWFVATEFNKLTGATEDAENTFKLALLGETIQKRGIQKEVAKELEDKFGRGADAQEVLISKIQTAQKAMKTMAEQKKQLQAPMEAPTVEPTPVVTAKPEAAQEVEPDIQQKARDILDDFMGGGGTREVDPLTGKVLDSKDEVKARLLTTDEEKRRLINVVTQVMDQDLKNVKGGRVGQLEYLAQVQNELSRRLGPKASQELGIVLNSAQVTDNFEVADAIRKLGIHMSANGAVMVQGYDDLIKFLDNADLNDINVVNNATASIIKLIPQQLAWKQAGAESGRLLQARKYTKDILTEQQKKVLAGLEGKLVKDVKEAKELTEEQLDEQIKTFGDIQVVKKLLKTIQQADDTAEVHQILTDQQKSFQNTWKEHVKEYLADPLDPNKKIPYLQDPYTGEAPTTYSKVRAMGGDVIYFKLLNNPVTHAKVLLSNNIMSNYNVMNGWIGAKFMATLPWTKEGISKQEWQRAGDFWQRVGASYGTFGAIANKEAMKALKSGESDLLTHFERIGKSAFSMERTGLSGPLGATLENVGRGVDMPGASMAAIDVRTRLNLAHAMTRAKAEIDYQKAVEKGEQVGTFQEYYNKFVGQIFTESKGKLMTEDQVRRKAVLMADKEGVAPENLASYMDNFVKQNWNKDISEFVNYIQRNLKEVTFTEEIGEFADPNVLEKANYFIEQFIRTYPPLHMVLNPFMRTGRNISRQAAAVTSPLLTLSRSIDKIPGANKIPLIKDAPRVAERLWTKTAKDLASDDPIVAARARGQQISSVGILLTAYGLAEGVDGLVQFVGTESQDWRMKKAIRTVTGMPEYTLRIADPTRPGKMKAVSLAALEPFNTILSVTADMKSLSNGTVAQREEARELYEVFMLALANNLTNKSYYKNLGDAMKLITEAASDKPEVQRAHAFRMLKGIAGQTVSSAQNALTYMSDDIIRENSNLMQVIARRMNGLSKLVPPMRDIFGDIQTRGLSEKRTGGLEILSPFGVFNERGDIDKYIEIDEVTGFRSIKIPKITKATVAQELRADKKGEKLTDQDIELAYQAKIREAAYAVCIELGVTPQFNGGTTKWEGIDLQDIRDPETQQDAFDRWQELANEMKLSSVLTPSKKGKTMKEAIVELASGGGYMSLGRFDYKKDIRKAPKTALPEGEEQKEDKRINLIKNVFKVYRDQALIQLKKEFPILEGEVESREEFQEELNKPFKPKSSMESEADYQRRLQKRREFELGAKETEFPAEQYQEQQVPSKLEELMLPFRN